MKDINCSMYKAENGTTECGSNLGNGGAGVIDDILWQYIVTCAIARSRMLTELEIRQNMNKKGRKR